MMWNRQKIKKINFQNSVVNVKSNAVHLGDIVSKKTKMTKLTHVSLNSTVDLMFY